MDLLNIKPNIISENLNDKIFLFYGEAGTYKTTVATSFPNHLLVAFEIGYKFINGVMAQPVQTWSEFKALVRQLAMPEVKEKYKTIVIDTVTLAYNACYDYVLNQFGVDDPGEIGFGKGWRLIRKEFEKTILSIPQMGYGLILIAHSDDMSTENEVRAKVDIDKRPASIIKGLSDFILYLHKEYKDGAEQTPENITVYAYSNLPNIETKSRSRYLSPRFEFTYENLKQEMEKAIQKQKVIEGITTIKDPLYLNKIDEVDFDTLKQEVVDIAKRLSKIPEIEPLVADKIINILGFKITDAKKIHSQKLLVLREELLELESRL